MHGITNFKARYSPKPLTMKRNVVGWFEIPVQDMDRAVRFYEKTFGFSMTRMPIGGIEYTIFPGSPDPEDEWPGTQGALVQHPDHYKPSQEGVLIYFTAPSGDLANELRKVEEAGGEVLKEKSLITEEIGYMGLILDSEGNRVALHSRN